jgi:hypothetical protein
MAATTRKRKSTRTSGKSKKAKAEETEEPAAEEEKAKEEPKADVKEEDVKAADSKDTHEAAAALLAVSGGDPKVVVEKNGDDATGELFSSVVVAS